MTTDDTPELPTTTSTPPQPVPPPHVVRLRVDVSGADYRELRHVSIETDTSINELTCEAVRMLVRWYATQGLAPAKKAP